MLKPSGTGESVFMRILSRSNSKAMKPASSEWGNFSFVIVRAPLTSARSVLDKSFFANRLALVARQKTAMQADNRKLK